MVAVNSINQNPDNVEPSQEGDFTLSPIPEQANADYSDTESNNERVFTDNSNIDLSKFLGKWFLIDEEGEIHKSNNTIEIFRDGNDYKFTYKYYGDMRAGSVIIDERRGVRLFREIENENSTIPPYVIVDNVPIEYNGKYTFLLDNEGPVGFFQLDAPISPDFQILIKYGIINDNNVRLRNEPNLTSFTETFLNTGDKVSIIDQSAEKQKIGDMEAYWYKVQLEDKPDGWVYGAYIDITE